MPETQHDDELPPLDELDALDQERAADMVGNRPAYGQTANKRPNSERSTACQTDTKP